MEIREIRNGFTVEFKRWVVSEIAAGKKNRHEVCQEYGIQGHSTIQKWFYRYGGNQDLSMSSPSQPSSQKDSDKQSLLLRNQVKALERELKESRLKQVVLETLIDIAERHYSISIKKNTGGKLSIK